MKCIVYLAILLTFVVTSFASAKEEKITVEDVTGLYSKGGYGPSIYLLPDQRMLLIGLGVMLKGKWGVNDNSVEFSILAEPAFTLYGRFFEELGDAKQLHLRLPDQEYRKHTINLNGAEASSRQGINCASDERLVKFEKSVKSMEFGLVREPDYVGTFDKSLELYTFSLPSKYNDFLIISMSDENLTTNIPSMRWHEGRLYLSEAGKGVQKQVISGSSEDDMKMIAQFLENDFTPPVLKWRNEFYPYIGPIRDSNNVSHTTEINGEIVSVYKEAYQHYLADFYEVPADRIAKEKIGKQTTSILKAECNTYEN